LNLKNLIPGGSYWNVVKVGFLLFMIFFITWSYMRDVRVCRELTRQVAENPQEFCLNITRSSMPKIDTSNWKLINISIVENG